MEWSAESQPIYYSNRLEYRPFSRLLCQSVLRAIGSSQFFKVVGYTHYLILKAKVLNPANCIGYYFWKTENQKTHLKIYKYCRKSLFLLDEPLYLSCIKWVWGSYASFGILVLKKKFSVLYLFLLTYENQITMTDWSDCIWRKTILIKMKVYLAVN